MAKNNPHKLKYIHVGKMIRDYINDNDSLTQKAIYNSLYLTKSTFEGRLGRAHYGTVYQLIDVCIACKYDFLSPLTEDISKKGVHVKLIPCTAKYREAIDNYDMVKEDAALYKSLLKKNVQ